MTTNWQRILLLYCTRDVSPAKVHARINGLFARYRAADAQSSNVKKEQKEAKIGCRGQTESTLCTTCGYNYADFSDVR